ncbi:hypothetical protein GQ53DRAFT_204374 [Thozetella sp. PMI_491]|nr:hypothetical protein GQ53DRAFT_204374 [Thozetella sp. PMI_491]
MRLRLRLYTLACTAVAEQHSSSHGAVARRDKLKHVAAGPPGHDRLLLRARTFVAMEVPTGHEKHRPPPLPVATTHTL